MRIYLDMCSIQRPLDDRTQLRVQVEAEAVLGILAFCESGGAELVDSDALRFETARNPYPDRRSFTEEALSAAKHFIRASAAVEQRSRGYIENGIKALDALHLASAVEAGADYFCTCDDRLLRRAKGVDTRTTRAVSMLELIEEIDS
jgi:predicted nucleic acid-binding protein